MLRHFNLILTCLILAFTTAAQSTFTVATGISIDVNNRGKFQQIPLSLHLEPNPGKKGAFLIKFDAGLPLSRISYDSAFTANTGLPPSKQVEKRIGNFWFSISGGYRFYLKRFDADKRIFLDLLVLGYGYQHFGVTYSNKGDKDYEVIDPDITIGRTGILGALGLGYVSGKFSGQVHIQSPISAGTGRYEMSYKLNAPLSITVGYRLFSKSKTKSDEPAP